MAPHQRSERECHKHGGSWGLRPESASNVSEASAEGHMNRPPVTSATVPVM